MTPIEILNATLSHNPYYLAVVSVITVASVISSCLPPAKKGSKMEKVRKVIGVLALNFGHAKK